MVIFSDILIARLPLDAGVDMQLFLDFSLIKIIGDPDIIGAGSSRVCCRLDRVILLEPRSIPESSFSRVYLRRSIAQSDCCVRVHHLNALYSNNMLLDLPADRVT